MRLDLLVSAMAIAVAIATVILTTAFSLRMDRVEKIEVQPVNFTHLEKELACMTKNIYWEAAGEPVEGKIAVAQVVMNRVEHPDFPDSVCEVVYQRDVFYSRTVCQFSWYCIPGFTNRRINETAWQQSEIAAKKVMLEGFRLPSLDSALYYHADYVNPRWRLDRITQIGRHIFYEPRNTI